VSRNSVLAETWTEREAQDERFGEQNHPMYDGRSLEWLPSRYAELANEWKARNDRRIAEWDAWGVPSDRNCSWDGILLEEVFEALAETDPVKIRAELIQVAAVAVAAIEAIDRRNPTNPCGRFGCTRPAGHNRGRADVPTNHGGAVSERV
jgi:hypothetical protein